MQPLVVYGPDGRTPIDPRSLPMADYRAVMDFYAWAKTSPLFADGPRTPEWATPMRPKQPISPAPSGQKVTAPRDTAGDQAAFFPLEVREKKGAKRRVRSIAE